METTQLPVCVTSSHRSLSDPSIHLCSNVCDSQKCSASQNALTRRFRFCSFPTTVLGSSSDIHVPLCLNKDDSLKVRRFCFVEGFALGLYSLEPNCLTALFDEHCSSRLLLKINNKSFQGCGTMLIFSCLETFPDGVKEVLE